MAGSFETRREVSGSDGVGNTRSLLGLVWQKLIPRRGGSLFRKRNIELHTHESFASFVETIRDSVRNANIPALVSRTRSNSTFGIFPSQQIHPSGGNRISTSLPPKKKNTKIIKYIPQQRLKGNVQHSVASFDLRFRVSKSNRRSDPIIEFLRGRLKADYETRCTRVDNPCTLLILFLEKERESKREALEGIRFNLGKVKKGLHGLGRTHLPLINPIRSAVDTERERDPCLPSSSSSSLLSGHESSPPHLSSALGVN